MVFDKMAVICLGLASDFRFHLKSRPFRKSTSFQLNEIQNEIPTVFHNIGYLVFDQDSICFFLDNKIKLVLIINSLNRIKKLL